MSEQGEMLDAQQPNFDAISCTGMLLILMFVLVGSINIIGRRINTVGPSPTSIAVAVSTAAKAPDLVPPTAVQDLVPALPTITSTVIRPNPTNTTAPPPTTLPTHTLTPIPTTTPSPMPTATATNIPIQSEPEADMAPTNVPTAIPTATPPLPTAVPGNNAAKVPILMYHYVSEPPANADIYRRDLSVHPDQLRIQLQYLRDNGYVTIDLYDLARALADVAPLPEKSVILTFDDGYRDNYHNAFPLLKEFGMKATFFVLTNPPEEWNNDYMTWPMLEEMAAAGMRIEPHTKSHPNLAAQKWDIVVDEVRTSRDLIADRIGYTPRFMAYPSGRYNQQTIDVLYALDYWGAVTTDFGSAHEFGKRYELGRKRMRYTTSLATFSDMLIVSP